MTLPNTPAVLVLDEDELVLGQAYAALMPVLDRMTAAPFDPLVYAEMRSYLDRWATPAAAAFARVCARGPADLEERANQILAARSGHDD